MGDDLGIVVVESTSNSASTRFHFIPKFEAQHIRLLMTI